MMEDPVEKIIDDALFESKVKYQRNKEIGGRSIDFYLPDFDLWIEVCQFHTPRKLDQLKVLPDVILIQGRAAARSFVRLIKETF